MRRPAVPRLTGLVQCLKKAAESRDETAPRGGIAPWGVEGSADRNCGEDAGTITALSARLRPVRPVASFATARRRLSSKGDDVSSLETCRTW